MSVVHREFLRRVSNVPHHGLGLSVDLYQPGLFELLDALRQAGLPNGYLEIFKASEPALTEARRALPAAQLEYHGEGLWMTQPDWTTAYPYMQELEMAARHLRALGSYWMTHECAAKQMAGYSFGTYLPPLFTRASAEVTAERVSLVQDYFDRSIGGRRGPLLLLEVAPLTYFGFGDLSIPGFFRRVTELSSCGLVLDIGHLWTIYRYTGEWRRCAPDEFLSEFLDVFPLERVVQIHVAGLAVHESDVSDQEKASSEGSPPLWIDAHGAPIPDLLWDMLDQVLAHPRLIHLKGMALEVDTKAVPRIVAEYRQFRERFGTAFEAHLGRAEGRPWQWTAEKADAPDQNVDQLVQQYRQYAQTVSTNGTVGLPLLGSDPRMLDIYRGRYLPHEILHWGGELEDMFPQSCRELARAGIPLDSFVAYWFREPRPVDGPYDFFLVKVGLFTGFVREMLPGGAAVAAREAAELTAAYGAACEDVPAPFLSGVPL